MTHELDSATNFFCMAREAEQRGELATAERNYRAAAALGLMQDTLDKIDRGTELWSQADNAEDAGDYDTAEKLFLASARLGKSNAMNALACLYDDRHIPRLTGKAIYWYVRGYRAGNTLCPWNLAMIFVRRRNFRWFRFWMRKAAEMGHEDAAIELAKIAADPVYMTDPVALWNVDESN